ncbi:MAG: bacteriocin fulvocin C-related protein [Moheibacter sp.]
MKNIFIYFSIFFTSLIIISCTDESNNEPLEESTDAERIYLSQRTEIQKMNRYYLAGLNIYIQQHAYKDFDVSKKRKLWIEKIEESKKINSLTLDQIKVLDDVKQKIHDLNLMLNSKESEIYIQSLKENLEKVNFDPILSQKIFSTLAPIDEHGELLNFNYTNSIATAITFDELDFANKGLDPYAPVDGGCNSGACFWCSPAYDDCTSSCIESDGIGCGFLLLEHCDVLCYNSN